MKSKKSLQKVLCVALATASVFSMIIPVSYAVRWKELELKNGCKVFVFDPQGSSEDATLLNLLNDRTMLAELKSGNNIQENEPCELRIFEATTNNERAPKYLEWLVRPNDPQQQAKEQAILRAYGNSLDYSKCDIVSERTMPVQSTRNSEGVSATKVVKVRFKNDPIVVDAEWQVENGLRGMMRDIILRLVRLLREQKARALFGMMWQIFVWKGSGAGKHALIDRAARMRQYDAACGCQQAAASFASLAPAERQVLAKDDALLKKLEASFLALFCATIVEPHYQPGLTRQQVTSELEKARTEAGYGGTTIPIAELMEAASVCLRRVWLICGSVPLSAHLAAGNSGKYRHVLMGVLSDLARSSPVALIAAELAADASDGDAVVRRLSGAIECARRYPAVPLTNDAKPIFAALVLGKVRKELEE
ncbi:hypothetical protein FACS189481_4680 [Clostridia bacterium]|nr:hypothetical protein FACS189481_4680 [Clostridia bacterium]